MSIADKYRADRLYGRPQASATVWVSRTLRPFTALLLLLSLVLPASAEVGTGEGYRLGRGYRIPALNLTLSGYFSLRFRDLSTEDARLDLRGLSLFSSWAPSPGWLVFSELEIEDAFSVDDDGPNASNAELVLERLYADYAATPSMSLRVGKFLTPVGRWNRIHADPLVWSVSRPLVTVLPAASHATGVAAYGLVPMGADNIEYIVYLDDSELFDPRHGDASFEDMDVPGASNDFDYAAGMQIRYHFLNQRAELAFSYAGFKMAGLDQRKHLLGVDAYLSWRRFEFTSEAAYRYSEGRGEDDQWGAFVQGVAPLFGNLSVFTRYEIYRGNAISTDARKSVIGLAYRPRPPVTLKLEYGDGNSDRLMADGWQVSWAVLF